jgi:hypothetical protein
MRITNNNEIAKMKTASIDQELIKLSHEVYKPSDTDDKIRTVYDLMAERLKEELEKLLSKVLTSLEE